MTAARKIDLAASYQDRLGIPWSPSDYQVSIWNWIETGRGHAAVAAVAGSGKSTTILQGAKLVSGPGMFLAFNKSIATELGGRLAGTTMRASTIHSHGYSACRSLGRLKVDSRKYWDLARGVEREAKAGRLFGGMLPARAARKMTDKPKSFPTKEIVKLVDLARLSLVDCGLPEGDFAGEIDDLAAAQGLQWDYAYDGVVHRVTQRLMQQGMSDTRIVDFTDMVWLPVVLGLTPKRYPWLFVDECQDLARASLELIKMSVARGGRVLFVGDGTQAIYGFAGADVQSFDRIVDFCDGATLPLSVCYRCPRSALDLARDFCPQIEAAPGAIEGIVREIKADTLGAETREGDMMLCRQTAPLVSVCLSLIGQGLPARVKGRDLGEQIMKVANAAAELSGFDSLPRGLDQWLAQEHDRAVKKHGDDEDRIADDMASSEDKAACARVIWLRSRADSETAFRAEVEEIFDDRKASIQLSTVHRAKGLEADRVFILRPELMECPRASTPEQMEQERNLFYVALTRCKKELIFVRGVEVEE